MAKKLSSTPHTPIYCLENFGRKADDASFYIEQLSVHLKKHEFVSEPHKHDFYLLLHIRRGGGTHVIDFQSYPIRPNSYFLMTPGQIHFWKLSPNTEGHIIFFTQDFYKMHLSDTSLLEFPFFHSLEPNPLIVTDNKSVAQIIDDLYEEFTNMREKDARILRSYLDLLLLKLARYYNDSSGASAHSDTFKLRKLEQLIDKHFIKLKQPSQYADLMNLSSSYLNTICKQNLNKTLSILIQERVNLEAKRLLAYTDLTVNDIAYRLRFSNTSHFIKYFKKTAGLTPDEFKESIIRTI